MSSLGSGSNECAQCPGKMIATNWWFQAENYSFVVVLIESSRWYEAFFLNDFLDNAASEGVLASFFNSLLSKKTGSPGSPGAGGVQSTAKKSGTKGSLETYDPCGWAVLEVGVDRSVCCYLVCTSSLFPTAKQVSTSSPYTEQYTL